MKELYNSLQRKDLIAIQGLSSSLGYKTKRIVLNNLKECEDWLRNKPLNSVRLLFEKDKSKEFKL